MKHEGINLKKSHPKIHVLKSIAHEILLEKSFLVLPKIDIDAEGRILISSLIKEENTLETCSVSVEEVSIEFRTEVSLSLGGRPQQGFGIFFQTFISRYE